MPIYTAPSMSFIDTYINAAKDRTDRMDNHRKEWFEGIGNLAKGGVDAYKWQQRKDILDKADALDKREKEILTELARLKGERINDPKDNIGAIMQNTNWRGIPFPYKPEADEFVPPKGIGIYKKELLNG